LEQQIKNRKGKIMIERYTRDVMKNIWSEENKFRKWLDVEIAACEAWNKLGVIPDDALKNIVEKANFNIDRINEIEKEVKHDVIAFLTSVAEFVGDDARFIHKGLTSSDVLDTAYNLLLKEAGEILIQDLYELKQVLKEQALKYKLTPMIGRSHGIHAEPITFGLKMALWFDETCRNIKRLENAVESVSYGKISGAVGTFANIEPFVEEFVCKKLHLKPAPVSTQIIQRDRHAEFFTTLGVIASSFEKFAVEIRHLQRTEVLEAEEFFSKGQKGSSAMPHKRNPVLSENVTGLARLVRSYSIAAMENVALWHERDISHSSVERVIGPDATSNLDFLINRFIGIIKNLIIYEDTMQKNIFLTNGLIFSQRVLLALTEKGISREKAYGIVQRNAMKVWEDKVSFKDLLLEDKDILKCLSQNEIDEIFNLDYHLKNINYIFKRVFGE
jgi:adenylosuccinate lyase